MNVLVARSPEAVQHLLALRWAEAQREVGSVLPPTHLSLEIGESPHFRTARGFATTQQLDPNRFHIKFAEKVAGCSEDRLDAVIRHELGHVLDLSVGKIALDRWAVPRGVYLPDTLERRADGIAFAVWRRPLRYDVEDVQSLATGVFPRPLHLGA